jgi:outer membrane protein, heavy metal efflux system
MKSMILVRCLRTIYVLFFACTALTGQLAYAGPLSEAEALVRVVVLPETTTFDTATSDVAKAEAQVVRRFENPELTVAREYVSGALGAETEWTAGVTQSLGLNGANGRLRAAAEAEAQAVNAELKRRKAFRLADVRKAYAECGAASERVTIHTEQDKRLRKVEQIIGLRGRDGDAAGYDLRRVRLEARSIAAQKALADGEVRAACATLSRLTGEADARVKELLFTVLKPMRLTVETGSDRSDLEAQRYRVAAAEAQADAARRQRLPDLAVGAGYKQRSDGGLSSRGPTISLGIRLPIFSGGSASRAAEARKRAVESELALSAVAVAADRDAALARAEAAYEAAQIAARTAEDARRISDIADASYQGGETDITDLIDGYRAGAEAQINAIDLAERALKARADHILAQEGED